MNKAVTAVHKMVIGGKADKWFLAKNYFEMNRVVKSCDRGLITDLEAIKALCNLSEESKDKECFFVTKKQFDILTNWRINH